MKGLIEDINKNIEYINEKDPHNIFALQSLSYIRERLATIKCQNCKHYIIEHTAYDNHCGRDGMWQEVQMLRCKPEFGCNKFEKKEE